MAEPWREAADRFNEQNPVYGQRARLGNFQRRDRPRGPGERPDEARTGVANRMQRQAMEAQSADPNAPVTNQTLEERLRTEMEAALSGSGAAGDDVLGGIENWSGPRDMIYQRPGVEPHQILGPREPYKQGDPTLRLREMPAEERARLQEVMVASGLTNSVIPGEIDPGTVAGFERMMVMANARGERWTDTFTRLKTRVERGELGDASGQEQEPFRFVEGSFLPPDPAESRNAVRNLAKQIVPGVELSDGEVELLRRQFEQFGQQEFTAKEQNRRLRAEADYRASAPVEPGTDEVIEQSSSVREPNAAARFREFFMERYEPNIERQGRVETGRQISDLVRGGTNIAAQMTGGR